MKKIDIGSYDKINMSKYLVLSGRELGNKIRKYFKLSECDKSDDKYEIIFPDNIISISTSFFLAVFGESVRNCESKDNFEEKYIFNVNSNLKKNINDGITDALNDVDGLSI